MRKVGSIPPGAFYNWYIKNGIANMSKVDRQAELMKFLNEHPEFRVVDKMKHDTAHQTHIIVNMRIATHVTERVMHQWPPTYWVEFFRKATKQGHEVYVFSG